MNKPPTLQEHAEHTLNIEYPGRTLEAAQVEANQRSYDYCNRIWELQDQLQHTQYLLDQATYEYHEAVRAANLFENALNEQDGAK